MFKLASLRFFLFITKPVALQLLSWPVAHFFKHPVVSKCLSTWLLQPYLALVYATYE